MSVNQTRSALGRDVSEMLGEAKVVGFNDSGEIAVWNGNVKIDIHDASDFQKVRNITSNKLVAFSDRDRQAAYDAAKERMESEGFTVVE